MSKVTSKLQLTVPKAIADQYGIRPGDELQWMPAGQSIRIELGGERSVRAPQLSIEEKLELFDRGSKRLDNIQRQQIKQGARAKYGGKGRGWTREELYHRGFPR
jgi:bifunctional DNA-binding transcriptional regulator/antitoxin component of YhaV-PrlF toxin-antitoxin module